MGPEFDKPNGLSIAGDAAHAAIVAFLKRRRLTYAGGITKVFYSPQEWAARGEKYGTNAVLIVVHDGGKHAPAFNWDYDDADLVAALTKALAACKLFSEQCTSWYSAIYEVAPVQVAAAEQAP